MRFIILLTLVLWSTNTFAEPLPNPTREVESAILLLQRTPEAKRQYIRFFTTYAVPDELKDKTVLTLSFLLHSLTGLSADINEGNAGSFYPLALAKDPKGEGGITPLKLAPGSKTLWWIDLRDYNWTQEAWEKVSTVDGYFVEPIVDHRTNGLLRLLAGNAVLRADWFIVNSVDLALQSDQEIDIPIYYTLLYAQNKIPTTIEDFRKVWGLNLAEALKYGNEVGVVVTKSKAVARHNRALFRYRTQLGYHYETRDVKFESGFRDYIESFAEFQGKPPTVFDAGEAFASNALGLQVYTLFNNKNQAIDFAASEVARHISDVVGDVRVRTSVSCMDCHSAGPIPPENTIREYVEGTGKLKLPDKQTQLRIDRTYLSGRFEDFVPEDQKIFAKSLLKTNGLDPETNVQNYLEVIKWYQRPLNLEQAAKECGVTPDEMKQGLQNKRISGRLALLLATGEEIPRQSWDNRGTNGSPGVFQRSMISLFGLTKIVTEKVQIQKVQKDYVVTQKRCNIYHGEVTKIVEEGIDLELTKERNGDWIGVVLEGQIYWINSKDVKQK